MPSSLCGRTLRHTVSRYISVNLMSLKFSATSRHFLRNRPSDILLEIMRRRINEEVKTRRHNCQLQLKLRVETVDTELTAPGLMMEWPDQWRTSRRRTYMMLALCTAVTLFLWLLRAYSKAYSAMRLLAFSVISLMLWTTPSTIWKMWK